MKLNRILAILIALSMLVGLMFTVPAAALTPVEGYAETVVIDESFDKSFSDKLTVFNGSVEEGALNFTLSSSSFMAINKGFDTNNKQVIVDFDMTTTKEYEDPWSASFIGFRLDRTQAKPSGTEYGAWVGVTADKLILWFSHKLAKWGSEDAVNGEDYLLVDVPSDLDLSNASYRAIYETVAVTDKSTVNVEKVELYANDGENEALIASFDFVIGTRLKSDGKEENYNTREVTLTSGENVFTSTVKFMDDPVSKYFTIYNSVVESAEDDPLAPKDPDVFESDTEEPGTEPEEPGDETNGGIPEDVETKMKAIDEAEPFVAEEEAEEYPVVTIDNLKVAYFNDLLVTDETIASLESKKEEFEKVIDAYDTEDEEDDVYIPNSLDRDELEDAVAIIDEILVTEGLLDADAQAMLAELDKVLANAVSVEIAESYPGRFANYEKLIADLLADPESGYTEERLSAVQDEIDAAKAVIEEDGVTISDLDAAYNSVMNAVAALNVYTEDGIPAYIQSFTGNYSLSQFEAEWYHAGSNHQLVAVTTENGIPINLWGPYTGESATRYQMHFRKSYPVYSVQATLTREATGRMMFGVRQTLGSDCFEQDYGVTPEMIGYQGVSIQEVGAANNFATIYIVVRDGQYKTSGVEDSRVYTKIDLTTLPGVLSEDQKTFTPLIKDFGEIIEIYAVNAKGENVPLAKIVFDAVVTKVTAKGTSYDGYSSGTLYNLVTDEVIPFTGMAVQLPGKSYISFSSRSGRYCVKDFQINTNIIPEKDTLVFDGSTEPTSVALEIKEDVIDVDGETTFAVNAEFESLKVAGKDEYKAGSIDVKAAPAVTVSTTLGDTVVSVDTTSGTIKAVARGTEIITATYTLADGSTVTDKKLITVSGDEYTAPTEEDKYEGRIVAARFANADVFKSVEKGTEIVPVIEYEYPNGDTGILPADCYVKYSSDDEDIMYYDEAKGAYVANNTGYTKLSAEVYMTLSTEPVETSKVNVEVAAEGEATLGAGAAVAAMDLVDAAKDDDLTTEEKKAVLDAAIENEIEVSYSDDLDVELLFAAIAAVAEVDDELTDAEIIAKANANTKAVRKVYDVINSKETTSDDLADLLFGDNGIYKELGISEKNMRNYDNLTNTKASRLMTRLFTQLAKKGTDLTAQSIVDSFETIYNSVKGGGGSGKGGITITTDKNNGNVGFVPATPAKPAEPVKKEVITEEQINVAVAKFSDVEEAAWAKHAIGVLTHKGIIDGYEDGTIRPNGMITRDEFVKLLVVAFKLDVKSDAYNYFWADVPANGWQVPYIAAAHEANILVGTDGGAFGSNVRITREDMAAMIYKAVLMKNAALPSDKIVAFTDAENIEGYAVEAVNKLAAAGVISGMGDGTFAPAAGATRAQAFQMIALVLEAI